MKIRTAGTVLALAGMLSAGQALADVKGQASLGNLRVTLFDLDLSDAVTPSITLSFPSGDGPLYETGSVMVSYLADSWHFSESYGKSVRATPGLPETLAYRHGKHAELSASLAHPTPLGQSLSLSSRLGPAGQHEFRLWGSAYSDTLGIVLSPNTRAVFSADLAFSGSTSALSSHEQELVLYASLSSADLAYSDFAGDYTTMRIGSYPDDQSALDDSDILSVAFSNTRDTERAGQLYFGLTLNAGLTPLAAVPEPASAAMLLAGVALLGWQRAGRRRVAPHR